MLALRAPLLAGTALAASLALAACQPGEDAAPQTELTEAEAEAGLAAFNLAEPGRITWDARTFEDGVFTFQNVSIDVEDTGAPLEIETLAIAAPRVEEEVARFDRLEIDGASVSEPTGGGVNTISIAQILVDQPGPDLSRLIADALHFRLEDRDPAPEDSLQGWTFTRLAMTGLNAELDEPGDGEASFALESLEADSFDGDTLQRAAMTGFVFDGVDPETGEITGRLDELSAEGLGADFLRTIAASGRDADVMPPLTFDPSNTYERFTMAGLDVNVAGAIVSMPLMEGEVTERGGAIRQTASMEEMTLEADASGELGAQLAHGLSQLGYEALTFRYAADSVYDPETDRARTEGENFFLIENAMRLSLDQDLSGVQAYMDDYMAAVRAGALEDGELPPDVFAPLTIHSIALTLEDLSLLERALDAAAEAQGSTPAQLRLQAGALIALGLAAAPSQLPRPFVTALGEAVNSFIQNGGSITVAMDPAEPVSVGEIMAQGAKVDVERLGLAVTAEPPQD